MALRPHLAVGLPLSQSLQKEVHLRVRPYPRKAGHKHKEADAPTRPRPSFHAPRFPRM
jgi:hypothetical protein